MNRDPGDASAPSAPPPSSGSAPDDPDDPQSVAIRSMLKRALGSEAAPVPPPDLLAGVQRRIRVRSRGRFFADGWSTGQMRISYGLAGLVTVALAILAYLALLPTGAR
jgi:hypothetical protein